MRNYLKYCVVSTALLFWIGSRTYAAGAPGNGFSTDSIPGKQQELVKEVPKSKKQVKPIAVPPVAAVIKPVVIKPKVIIKPVIKLH